MKRLLATLCAVLALAGCSDKETAGETQNPYLPIGGLVIPREGLAGENVTLQGSGFAADCGISLQLNGAAAATEVTVVSVDDTSLVFTLPSSFEMGFYVILLRQNDATHRIGGINVRGDRFTDEDFEFYVLAGSTREIYPASMSKQLRGREAFANSSTLIPDEVVSGVEALPDGRVYYASRQAVYEDGSIRTKFKLGSCNLATGAAGAPRDIADFFAMGQIGGELHILTTSADYKTYTLLKWNDGTPETVRTFDLGAVGASRILPPDLRFVCYEKEQVLLVYGTMGTGEDLGKVTFTLDLLTGAVTQNGNNVNYSYCYVVAGETLYAIASLFDDDTEKTSARILRIDTPRSWTLGGEGCTRVASLSSGFALPVYSPVTGLIYGVDDAETFGAMLSFDPAAAQVGTKRWVNPQIAGFFYAPQIIPAE